MSRAHLYPRTAHFWAQVREAFLFKANIWGKGSEGRALIDIAHSDNWLEIFAKRAPASRYVPPGECAQIIIYKLLS
jgi:hypothetical protein